MGHGLVPMWGDVAASLLGKRKREQRAIWLRGKGF